MALITVEESKNLLYFYSSMSSVSTLSDALSTIFLHFKYCVSHRSARSLIKRFLVHDSSWLRRTSLYWLSFKTRFILIAWHVGLYYHCGIMQFHKYFLLNIFVAVAAWRVLGIGNWAWDLEYCILTNTAASSNRVPFEYKG